MPDLPELGARSANSFGKVAALPWASSAHSVCSVGFLVANGTHLCKNGGSWGAGEKACAPALQGLWLQPLTQALFPQNSTAEGFGGSVELCLTLLSERRLGAAWCSSSFCVWLWARRTRRREQRTLNELSAPVLRFDRPRTPLQRAWRASERVLGRCEPAPLHKRLPPTAHPSSRRRTPPLPQAAAKRLPTQQPLVAWRDSTRVLGRCVPTPL